MDRSIVPLLGFLALSAPLFAEPSAVRAVPLEQAPELAQMLPPETFKDPVAQVDPDEPIQIRVINESDVDVGALVRFPPTDTRIATPGESVTFGVLHTSFLPPPIDFQVYALIDNSMIDDLTLETDIVAENNAIIITTEVVPNLEATTAPGIRRGMRVTESGEVYLF